MLTFFTHNQRHINHKGKRACNSENSNFSIYAVNASSALTVHDFDADSAVGFSIITDDRSSCWISDDDEVSECMHVYHNATFVNEKSMQLCKRFVSSKSFNI